jgi:hypothetical protein
MASNIAQQQYNVLGPPATFGGFTFQPAELPAAARSGPLAFPLHDFAGQPPPAVLQLAFERQYDAAWVRARLPRVFGFTPVFVEEAESALLDVGFVAQSLGEAEVKPFVCADSHGRAHLGFPVHNGADGPLRKRIAQAFWGLLLAQPDDLADFEQMVYHEPTEIWLRLGCLHGMLYCEASED